MTGDAAVEEPQRAPSITPLPSPVDPAARTGGPARLQARIQIVGGPDWLGAGFGSVWVRTDSGTVARAGAVWTCDESDIVRIDPATNAVTATMPVGNANDQGQPPVALDRMWGADR